MRTTPSATDMFHAGSASALHQQLRPKYKQIIFINLSLRALGTIGSSSETFVELLKCFEFNSSLQKSILSKIVNTTITCTYLIFCRRNKPWTDPNFIAYSKVLSFIVSLHFIYLLFVLKPATTFCS